MGQGLADFGQIEVRRRVVENYILLGEPLEKALDGDQFQALGLEGNVRWP